jgi:flagellar biogenesis protein FliO
MDSITIILITYLASIIALVGGVMWLVRKVKLDQKRRQQAIVKMAKEKEELTQVNGLKDQLLAEKDKVLGKYREILKI